MENAVACVKEAEDEVFRHLVSTYGLKAWKDYKNTFNQYLRGELLDDALVAFLSIHFVGEKMSLHNNLIFAIHNGAYCEEEADDEDANMPEEKELTLMPGSTEEALRSLPGNAGEGEIGAALTSAWGEEHAGLAQSTAAALVRVVRGESQT